MEQRPATTILLELLPADAKDSDPALINAIGTEVATLLRQQGETVEHAYTGQRGGELVLQIINAAWANKDLVLSDLSSLVTVLTPVALIAQHIKHAYAKRAGQQVAEQHPVTVTLEIKGMTVTVEAPDAKDAKEVTTQLAQQVLAQPLPAGDQALLPQTVRVGRASCRERV